MHYSSGILDPWTQSNRSSSCSGQQRSSNENKIQILKSRRKTDHEIRSQKLNYKKLSKHYENRKNKEEEPT